jgi:BirA family biotin operon repressor/biotin-[acetyl-CoA-carboxylase] ligase
VLSPRGSSPPVRRSRSASSSPLDRASVAAALGPARRTLALEIVDSVDSTNSELLRRAEKGDVHGLVIVAERQTAGRGRRGRGWTSIAGGSLVFSLGWRFARRASDLTALSLAVGLALVDTLEGEGFAGIGLKWPNDLVHRERKLGGVLVELSGPARGASLAVIGIGINVRLSPSVRRTIDQPVTDLATIAPIRSLDRSALLGRLLAEQARMLERYAASGFTPMHAAWQRRHALHGRAVQVQCPDGRTIGGTVTGVDSDGALRVSTGDGTARLLSGEVSLRRP